MRRRRLPHQRPNQFERALLVVMLFPYVLVKVTLKLAFNYSLLAIALMTPVDWNEEEEDLRVVPITFTELKEKIISGDIKDASTCNAVGLAMLKGLI